LENNVEDVTQSKFEKLEENNIAITFGPSKGLDIEVTMPCDIANNPTKKFKKPKVVIVKRFSASKNMKVAIVANKGQPKHK
jgi:hypothetical protein